MKPWIDAQLAPCISEEFVAMLEKAGISYDPRYLD
jgi:hypothetical protein